MLPSRYTSCPNVQGAFAFSNSPALVRRWILSDLDPNSRTRNLDMVSSSAVRRLRIARNDPFYPPLPGKRLDFLPSFPLSLRPAGLRKVHDVGQVTGLVDEGQHRRPGPLGEE